MSLRKIIGFSSVAALTAITVYGMGCSSSTNSGGPGGADSSTKTDTGTTKTDSSVADTGGGDSSGGDTGAGDAATMCPDNTPFTAIMWAPPTALHQGACTAAQIAAWDSSQSMTTGLGTSGNAACDACIVTPESATKHGPVITQTSMGTTFLAEFNIGGCVADEDGATAAGSCGNQLNNQGDCLEQECGDCSDFMNPTKGGPTATCENAIFGMGGVCVTDLIGMGACATELQADGGQQICLAIATNEAFFTLWCGGATEPTDSGTTDTGTPPADAAGEGG